MKAGHMDIDLEEVEQLPELFKDAKRDARLEPVEYKDVIPAGSLALIAANEHVTFDEQ